MREENPPSTSNHLSVSSSQNSSDEGVAIRRKPVVAIDGPAASGKSTVARLVARALGYIYIDTGSMYRALTLKCLRDHVDVNDEDEVSRTLDRTRIAFDHDRPCDHPTRIFMDGEDVSSAIRTPEVNAHVSIVASHPSVRQRMTERQRELASEGGAVLEGRDIGTVVFPDADVKFFLTAQFDERVRRRFIELRQSGINVTREDVARDISTRDKLDSERKAAPLSVPEDAIVIDTTNLSIEDVLERVLSAVRRKKRSGFPTEGSA